MREHILRVSPELGQPWQGHPHPSHCWRGRNGVREPSAEPGAAQETRAWLQGLAPLQHHALCLSIQPLSLLLQLFLAPLWALWGVPVHPSALSWHGAALQAATQLHGPIVPQAASPGGTV